ncbi:MAG TPA: Na(+)/H(+) antiporter subunit D [Gammaproteobacteria bacterium]|nr:Na(+)/H(+) antiporter subunit D [Gammaproteobacteria bacterium]
MIELPPFLIFFAAGVVAAVSPNIIRAALTVLVPAVSGLLLFNTDLGNYVSYQIFDYQGELYRLDELSRLFGYLFHIAAFIGGVYALHIKDRVQQISVFFYAGSALGAVMAGDLVTLFVFWEIAAISSVALIWARRTMRSYHSGMRYLIIQIASGILLLIGCVMLLGSGGEATFGYIGTDSLAGWLILAAFGIKAAFPFVHSWLTDSYPEATPTGTVFLSAFTTKLAIYALARGYPGTELLVYIGMMMTAFPIFYAVIENDLRRVLGYSMINQLGFMVCGIGIGTELAINGAVAHAFNDVIFKGLLFMSMGAVLHMTGKMNGSDLGGLYKSMPITTTLCIVGAASISAFPLFSGFVSKSMVMSAALSEDYLGVWLVLLFASAGVFHHAGIKIPYFAFFAHDSGIRTTEPPSNMLLAMAIAACLCIGIGCFPQYLYALLPCDTGYWPFDATHVIAQVQILFFSALAFVWLQLKGIYPPELRSVNLDVEWVYRRFVPRIWVGIRAWFARSMYSIMNVTTLILTWIHDHVTHHYGPKGTLSRSWSTGSMMLWVLVLLGSYLLLYFV